MKEPRVPLQHIWCWGLNGEPPACKYCILSTLPSPWAQMLTFLCHFFDIKYCYIGKQYISHYYFIFEKGRESACVCIHKRPQHQSFLQRSGYYAHAAKQHITQVNCPAGLVSSM